MCITGPLEPHSNLTKKLKSKKKFKKLLYIGLIISGQQNASLQV